MKNNRYDALGYFKLLDLDINASEEQIRQNYKDLAKKYHPDYNSSENAINIFKQLSVAYDTLKDSDTRLRYNLLSMVYNDKNFPDMKMICTLKNMHGQEDVNIRAFRLIEITGKGLLHTSIDKVYHCSPYEASSTIEKITKHNWVYGFWGLTAIFANIKAIFSNIVNINNKKDNFPLFIHNALAYELDNKLDEALTLAVLAKECAQKGDLIYINNYIEKLKSNKLLALKKWNFKKLKRIQLFYPIVLVLGISAICSYLNLRDFEMQRKGVTKLNELVIYSDGKTTYSDVSVAKIFDIPVNIYDKKQLYYFKKDTIARHGADDNFDVYQNVPKQTTVRVTGYTADGQWSRVMFDSGVMAFVKSDSLEQGIGKEIPLWSKIYKEE
jgi:hypothetical protein